MKHIITRLMALLAVLFAPQLHAQNYEQMWQDVADAFNNDLPKSALTNVRKIRMQALADDNQPQLLRALTTEVTIARQIAPDSTLALHSHIRSIIEAEQRPVEKALWQSALGQLESNGALIKASLSQPDLLADAKASDYVPAFVIGHSSGVFSDDLLHVLAESAFMGYCLSTPEKRDLLNTVRDVYQRRHNELAALVLDFNVEQNYGFEYFPTDEMIARIRRLMPEAKRKDAQWHTNIAPVMQRWVDKKEAPCIEGRWSGGSTLFYPGERAKWTVSSNNLPKIDVRIYRVNNVNNITSYDKDKPEKLLRKKSRLTLVTSIEKELQHTPAHHTFEDEIEVTMPAPGIYIIELKVDGKTQNASFFSVSSVAPLFLHHESSQGTATRLTIVDAKTGRPITENVSLKTAHIKYSDVGVKTPTHWKDVEPSADGSFDITNLGYDDYIAIAAGDDAFYPYEAVPYSRKGYFSERVISDQHVRLYTDRAIYRPGQKVQVGGIVYSRLDDQYDAVKDLKGQLVLQDANRKDVAELSVSTDDFGQFNAEFTLPDPAVPGRFAVVFRGQGSIRGTEYIQVEEYKRPTLRVKVEEADCQALLGRRNWAEGDTLVLRGIVETYSSVPVPETIVHWHANYEDWSWLRSSGQDTEYEPGEGELKTDDEGRFEIRFRLERTGYYRTSIEATATNGETASTQHTIYIGQRRNEETPAGSGEEPVSLFTEKYNKERNETSLTINLNAERSAADRPVYLFYDVVSTKGGLIKSERKVLTDSVYSLTQTWQPEYGDAVEVFVAFVKNGTLYSHSFAVTKPLPDKKLTLTWSTFRDHLQPGEQETWTLNVKRPDGTPADASIMARMYDATLDAFTSRPWNFNLDFFRNMPSVSSTVHRLNNGYKVFYFRDDSKLCKQVGSLQFTHWEPTMFDYFEMLDRSGSPILYECVISGKPSKRAMRMSSGAASNDMLMALQKEAPMFAESMALPMADAAVVEEAAEDAAAEAMSMDVRENFDETAFFMPCLRTDADGNVTLNFTLPESLTQWNFTALAHDKEMCYGILNDTIVAQKQLMTEIAAPRFLREGDKTEIPVTVRNLSDNALEGDLIFVVTDAKTAKVLKSEKRRFGLETKNALTTERFALEATCDVNVRAVAKAAEFSDGEERNIPFIDGRETIQVSIPFSSTQKGNIRLNLKALNLPRLMKQDMKCKPQLSVEYCANPIWNVVRAVPALLEGEAYSATDWATRLYAIEVGDFLATRLHATPSGALVDSLLSAKDIPALRFSALDHLKDFQNGDGGFSWFRGFTSSFWITTDVSILLARQQKMTGSSTAQSMLSKAVKYLEEKMGESVKMMKKNDAKSCPESALRYLYVRELLGLEPDKDAKYLLGLAAKEKKSLTMYGKGLVAQILQQNHDKEALLALQSLVEFTVATPEMGRYFDTERALSGWASYKIPTQTMAIEALTDARQNGIGEIPAAVDVDGKPLNDSNVETLLNEFKLWLLQSKRTQQWESSRASADATYALLHGDCNPKAPSKLFQTLAPENYSKRQLSPEETHNAIAVGSYNINKETDGLSWGALYAEYTLPIEQVEPSSAGFTLTRRWEVLRDGMWQPVKKNVKVGEHVRQIVTIEAERDYDFVQVECSRAACLQPLQPLSGISWQGGTTCYRIVRDSRCDYYFEHLAKGTHTVTEELIVDRTGTFTTGLARVQSTFAPEFSAYAPTFAIFATLK